MACKKIVSQPAVDDLVKLAGSVNLPADFFYGDIDDEAEAEAELIAEGVKEDTLRAQLEWLYLRGYSRERLAELIRGYRE